MSLLRNIKKLFYPWKKKNAKQRKADFTPLQLRQSLPILPLYWSCGIFVRGAGPTKVTVRRNPVAATQDCLSSTEIS